MLLIEENGSNIMFSGTEDPKGNNSFTSSTEYLVPLEGADDDTELEGLDFADKTTPRNRTFSSSPGDSSKGRNSFDEYFSAPESMEKYADDNDNDYDSSDDDVFAYKQTLPEPQTGGYDYRSSMNQNQQQTQQYGKDTAPIQPTRRTRSDRAVSFQESGVTSYMNGLDHAKAKENANYFHCSPNKFKKRSMEIRMDGQIKECTHTNIGKRLISTIRPDSPTNSNDIMSPSVVNSVTSLSLADSDDMLDINNDGGMPDIRNLEVEESNRNRPPSFAAPDDDSDASNTTGTRFVLADRVLGLFNFRRISVAIVKWFPCFWFWCSRHNNQLHGGTLSDRFILARLNVMSFFFATVQLAACVWLCVVLFVDGPEQDFRHGFHLWNNNCIVAFIGVLAIFLLCTCFWTKRIIKEVDLVGALRFLWLLLWILPIATFLNIVAFDYHGVTKTWIKHYWNSAQLWWFREQFCEPDTAETLCTVPIRDEEEEEEWCEDRYNTTGCANIRNEAQDKTEFFLLIFYRALASWGCIYLFIMFLIVKCLERIISKPMVQKSREVNVVGWLTFPVFCTAIFGGINLFSTYSYLDKLDEQRWIAFLYLIAAGLFLIALLMGWYLSAFSIRSNIDKQKKRTANLILIGVLFVNAFVLLTIFVTSILWSHRLDLTPEERGGIACIMNRNECTNCNATIGEDQCPEWEFDDVEVIVRRQLKESAILAAIFILYDLNVMKYGLSLRKHLRMYEIDYV